MGIRRYFMAMLGSFALAGNAQAGVKAAIVKLNEGGPNYLYSAQKISPGDTVHFQRPKDDQPSCCGRSHWKAATLLPSEPDAVEYDSDRELYRYRLSVTGISTTLPFLGIAVIGNKVDVEQDGAWRLKARQAGTKADLLLCTSQEGVHVVSRRDGKADSHLYLYLGYDIENPTCTPAMMK
jgi:hypothetical protein